MGEGKQGTCLPMVLSKTEIPSTEWLQDANFESKKGITASWLTVTAAPPFFAAARQGRNQFLIKLCARHGEHAVPETLP